MPDTLKVSIFFHFAKQRFQPSGFGYHVQKVDGSFQRSSGSGGRSFLSFLQHPSPVPGAVLLALGPRRRSLR